MGRNLDSNQHWIAPLTSYNPNSGEYELGKIVSVRTVRVFEDQFPLRCTHTSSTNLEKFEGFVDRFDPLYQHSDDAESPDQEFYIQSIIGTKHRGRAKRCALEWASGETSLEPESSLREDVPSMLDEYIEKVRAAEAACVVQSGGRSDVERMVSELMRKYKQEGSVEE